MIGNLNMFWKFIITIPRINTVEEDLVGTPDAVAQGGSVFSYLATRGKRFSRKDRERTCAK